MLLPGPTKPSLGLAVLTKSNMHFEIVSSIPPNLAINLLTVGVDEEVEGKCN